MGAGKINDYQKNRFTEKIIELTISNDIPLVAILGWAFKKETNDSRESASIYIVRNLLMQGYRINIYDPWVKTDKISEDIKISLKEKFYLISTSTFFLVITFALCLNASLCLP